MQYAPIILYISTYKKGNMKLKLLYEIYSPKTLFEMTWEEVSELLEETETVILPVGSTEQHGPHLPLGSDAIQATDFAKRMVKQLDDEGIKVVAAPTIQFGVSRGHMVFPGTISISSSCLSGLIKEICHSLYAHGFRNFLLLSGHGGNFPTMNFVARELAIELTDAYFIVPNWLPIMGAKYPEILTSDRPKDEHHSGEGETSRMLASTPNLVEIERAKISYPEEGKDPYRPRPYSGPVVRARGGRNMKDATPFGSHGNPLIAKKETGEKLYDIIVNWLCEVLKAEFTLKE
jgi:creatinine amidohydrolase